MWTLGRQGTGYKKLKIFQIAWPFGMDGYLLRYDSGDYIPEHTDPVTDKKHYRLNIIIWQSGSGGTFVCEKTIINLPRIKLFRPDLHKHQLTPVENGVQSTPELDEFDVVGLGRWRDNEDLYE